MDIIKVLENAIKPKSENYSCHMDGKTVRCSCGGQVMVDASLHPLVDLGMGFRRGKFVVDKVYAKKIIGYRGACMKCRKEGNFLFPAG